MRPTDGEATHDFVLRVEATRRLANIPEDTAFTAFPPFFSYEFAQACDRHKSGYKVRFQHTVARRAFQWSDIVSVARDLKFSPKFTDIIKNVATTTAPTTINEVSANTTTMNSTTTVQKPAGPR